MSFTRIVSWSFTTINVLAKDPEKIQIECRQDLANVELLIPTSLCHLEGNLVRLPSGAFSFVQTIKISPVN